jgi:hypothetical protein
VRRFIANPAQTDKDFAASIIQTPGDRFSLKLTKFGTLCIQMMLKLIPELGVGLKNHFYKPDTAIIPSSSVQCIYFLYVGALNIIYLDGKRTSY